MTHSNRRSVFTPVSNWLAALLILLVFSVGGLAFFAPKIFSDLNNHLCVEALQRQFPSCHDAIVIFEQCGTTDCNVLAKKQADADGCNWAAVESRLKR